VPSELLIDRRDELDTLARRAADRVAVRLVAPRRFGKTSVLLAHAQRLRDTGWHTVHVDLSRVADLTDVARRVAAGYAHLDASTERAVLAAVADGTAVTSPALAAEHGVARTTLAAAADRLAAQGHLEREARRTTVVDPLPAEWLRRR